MRPKFDPAIHDEAAPLTEEFMAGMKPSTRGRPRSADAKRVVSLRLPQSLAAKLEAEDGWRAKVEALIVEYVEHRDA